MVLTKQVFSIIIIKSIPVDVNNEEIWKELTESNPNLVFDREDMFRLRSRTYERCGNFSIFNRSQSKSEVVLHIFIRFYVEIQNEYIAIVGETWLRQDECFFLKNFDIVKTGKIDRRRSGVAIMVTNNIKYKLVGNLYNADDKVEVYICAINITLQYKPITLISLYKPPNTLISYTEWKQLFSQFSTKFLVGGDFNLHHFYWDDTIYAESRKLAEVVEDLSLQCLNNSSPTRFATLYSQSAIDITFSNCTAAFTAHWEVI